jgi:ubiquitin carboxyl-terminal hydrolase L5
MENDFEKWQKLRKKPKLSPRKKTSKQKKSEEEGPAFHFIAYVPVHDHVWRMDGMQKNPLNLGRIDGNWLTTARNNIYEQMAKHPDDQTYNFMALCKSPHTLIKSEMASNTRSLQDIEAKLTSINAEWRQFLESSAEESTPPREMDESFGLTPEIIAASLPNPSVAQRLERAGTDMEALIMLRAKLILEEKRLQAEHCEEVMEDSDEADKVKMHLKDYGPDMYKLVKTVLENGTLKAIWDDL